jgi:signal transduction histidine kinase
VKSKPPSRNLDAGASTLRELQAAREIARAFLDARHPAEVYRLALEKVAPLVGASFGCVFLREKESGLLRIVAAHNWPQAFASYLSTMRVKVGNGPTGRAVEENELIEVQDIFADEALKDWWEAAKELGFASSVSVPLAFHSKPMGAVTFYFREPERFQEADRSLLRLVADQLAATAEKAHLIDDLQNANEQLREQNVDLEAKYREAEEAKRLKNEFLANVSHELRTPLTAILGYSYLLREGMSGALGEEQAEAVDKIEGAGNTLMGLINDLLDLTHLKLGRTVVERELCDAIALSRAALSAAPAPVEGVEVRTETPPERIPIHTDAVLVVRILQKLISNAIKFTTEGAVTIRVRTGAPKETAGVLTTGPVVLWEIEDTGIGIAPDAQSAIFDEFRQVDGSATRRFGGAGLGLALSQGLAHRLGGEITVRSTLGEGSIFTLALPASVIHAGQGKSDDSSSTPGLAAAS